METKLVRLIQAYQELEVTYTVGERYLGQFEDKYRIPALPERNEVIALLTVIQNITLALGNYLAAFQSVFNDFEAKRQLFEIPSEQRRLGVITTQRLFYPYSVILHQFNALWEHENRTYLWEQMCWVYIEYAYFDHKKLPMLPEYMAIATGPPEIGDKLVSALLALFSEISIRSLYALADRAMFLSVATEEQLQADKAEKSSHKNS